jgi:hypothetical protein
MAADPGGDSLSGDFQARVVIYPPAVFSSGPDFCHLAESVGVHPFAWQRWVLEKGLGETSEGKWASFDNTLIVPRQNGKDEVFLILGLGWLFVTKDRLIGHSAHEYKTAMEAFRRLVAVIDGSDALRRKVKKVINTNGEEGIELVTGQRMRFLARSKGAGRGFSFDKMIWNEAYALTAPQVDAVLPTMSARPNPQLWRGSSPPLDAATGEPLFQARRAALAGAESISYFDFGVDFALDKIGPCRQPLCTHAPGMPGCILDDPELWARANPSYPRLISREAIQRERNGMDPQGFARERLGAWPPDMQGGYRVISKEQWAALKDPDSGKGDEDLAKILTGAPCFAVSVSPRNKGRVNGSIAIAQMRADGIRHLELILFGPGSVWIPKAFAGLHAKYQDATFVVDPGSPAGSLIADIQALGVPVTTMGPRDVAQAFGMIYDAATSEDEEGRTIAHLGQPEPDLAVRVADTRTVGEGHTWDTRNPAADITSLDAMTKALWGLASQTGDVAVEPWVMFA